MLGNRMQSSCLKSWRMIISPNLKLENVSSRNLSTMGLFLRGQQGFRKTADEYRFSVLGDLNIGGKRFYPTSIADRIRKLSLSDKQKLTKVRTRGAYGFRERS